MQFTIHEAKTQLSKLIAAAERGEEVIIARRDKPVVRIVAEKPERHRRELGFLASHEVKLDGFFDPVLDEQIAEGLKQQGVMPLGIDAVHCRRIQDLPFHQRDPFDRMLTAQCHIEGMTIISSDAIFDTYGIKRVW